MLKKFQYLLLQFIFTTTIAAQTVTVGSGSYTTQFPGTDVAGRNAYPSGVPYLIDSLKSKPVPTNDWWISQL